MNRRLEHYAIAVVGGTRSVHCLGVRSVLVKVKVSDGGIVVVLCVCSVAKASCTSVYGKTVPTPVRLPGGLLVVSGRLW